MAGSTAIYRFFYRLARGTIGVLYRVKAVGLENMPEVPAVLYANHSHWVDPLLMIFAVGKWRQVCMMTKAELFKIPVSGWFFRTIDAIPVERGSGDFGSLQTAVFRLANGNDVGIFPEGTRTKTDGEVRPKSGFVRIAELAGAPLVPVYVARRKSLFHSTPVVFGKPFLISGEQDEAGKINYPRAAREVMRKVWELKSGVSKDPDDMEEK